MYCMHVYADGPQRCEAACNRLGHRSGGSARAGGMIERRSVLRTAVAVSSHMPGMHVRHAPAQARQRRHSYAMPLPLCGYTRPGRSRSASTQCHHIAQTACVAPHSGPDAMHACSPHHVSRIRDHFHASTASGMLCSDD